MIFSSQKLDRFRERIRDSVSVDSNGCWLWQKTKAPNGYGSFALGGGDVARAHRIAYMAFVGQIPDGHDVCHRCDVRACVNPSHLFTGTRSENIMDASRKNRLRRIASRRGSDHPAAKLKERDIPEIRKLLLDRIPKTEIARRYGVSDRIILLISRGLAWRHVA